MICCPDAANGAEATSRAANADFEKEVINSITKSASTCFDVKATVFANRDPISFGNVGFSWCLSFLAAANRCGRICNFSKSLVHSIPLMRYKWFPWRFIVKKLARRHGFLDPFSLLAQMRRFSQPSEVDRKSTRLNSSHVAISYA